MNSPVLGAALGEPRKLRAQLRPPQSRNKRHVERLRATGRPNAKEPVARWDALPLRRRDKLPGLRLGHDDLPGARMDEPNVKASGARGTGAYPKSQTP